MQRWTVGHGEVLSPGWLMQVITQVMIAAGGLWKKDKVCLKSTLCSLPVFRAQLSESVPTRMKKTLFSKCCNDNVHA